MLRFSQVDVFTDRLLSGNPVAVVHDADDLTTEQMGALARWTNLSETTFLLTPTDPDADYRLRIFTPSGELPFAGHPTLGSARAWLLAGGSAQEPGGLVQECGVGLVPLRRDGDRLAFAAPPLRRSGPVDTVHLEQVAQGLDLELDDIIDAQWADNGPGWVAVLLKDAETVLALQPQLQPQGELSKVGVVGPYPPGAECAFELRAFVDGVREDPVTGSLNAAVAQWLIGTGQAPRSYVASQGTRLQRRGRIYVHASAGEIWIGGDTVLGVTGMIAL